MTEILLDVAHPTASIDEAEPFAVTNVMEQPRAHRRHSSTQVLEELKRWHPHKIYNYRHEQRSFNRLNSAVYVFNETLFNWSYL